MDDTAGMTANSPPPPPAINAAALMLQKDCDWLDFKAILDQVPEAVFAPKSKLANILQGDKEKCCRIPDAPTNALVTHTHEQTGANFRLIPRITTIVSLAKRLSTI
jgi:hypothetical protein